VLALLAGLVRAEQVGDAVPRQGLILDAQVDFHLVRTQLIERPQEGQRGRAGRFNAASQPVQELLFHSQSFAETL
jgi:hypothetical protein